MRLLNLGKQIVNFEAIAYIRGDKDDWIVHLLNGEKIIIRQAEAESTGFTAFLKSLPTPAGGTGSVSIGTDDES